MLPTEGGVRRERLAAAPTRAAWVARANRIIAAVGPANAKQKVLRRQSVSARSLTARTESVASRHDARRLVRVSVILLAALFSRGRSVRRLAFSRSTPPNPRTSHATHRSRDF